MTLSSDLSGPSVEPRVIRKQYAMEMAVERTRLLYQGSLLPTLFMLINGLVCAGLLWSPQRYFLVSVWLIWLLSLVALRVIQVAALIPRSPTGRPIRSGVACFCSALSDRPDPGRRRHRAGPADNFMPASLGVRPDRRRGALGQRRLRRQPAGSFLSFTLPCLLPAIGYLFWGGDEQGQGWGWFGLILLGAFSVVAWQVNRLIDRGCCGAFKIRP